MSLPSTCTQGIQKKYQHKKTHLGLSDIAKYMKNANENFSTSSFV